MKITKRILSILLPVLVAIIVTISSVLPLGLVCDKIADKNSPTVLLADTYNTTSNDIVIGQRKRVGWEIEQEYPSVVQSNLLYLPTIQFGSFPQDYVGDSMNTSLSEWKKTTNPTPVASYKEATDSYIEGSNATWTEYSKNGKLYVVGQSNPINSSLTYRNGDKIKESGQEVWFEVQPITWYVLNLSQWLYGIEDLKLLSEIALTAGSEDEMQWLNDNFYNIAFSSEEKAQIKATSDGQDPESFNNVYSFTITKSDIWINNHNLTEDQFSTATCSPSDYAISNYCSFYEGFTHDYRDGVCEYTWCEYVQKEDDIESSCVWMGGGLGDFYGGAVAGGIRPQLTLNVSSKEDTGASAASAGYKGGAIFLEQNCTFDMKGGTISGHTNKYGGAIFISSGATFTMTGGTIENNTADYGGAIYVEAGGHCYIDGGTIQNNKAKTAPAIYAEAGADVRISGNAIADNNETILDINVSNDTIEVGKKGGGVQLHYLYLGSYPQSYVGDQLNTTLESWYKSSNPAKVQDYVNKAYADATENENRTFTSYKYTDGNLYARGVSYINNSSYTYKGGITAKATGQIAWFKVEPIRWVVLNYDEWKSGSANIEIISEEALTGCIQFNKSQDDGNDWNSSWLKTWLNGEFLNSAFTDKERGAIVSTPLKNNITNGYYTNPSDEESAQYWPVEKETDDKIYLLSYYDFYYGTGPLSGRGVGVYQAKRYCSPSDYALSNNTYIDTAYETNNRQGTAYWWLRSAGNESINSCFVSYNGGFSFNSRVDDATNGIRPVLHLKLTA